MKTHRRTRSNLVSSPTSKDFLCKISTPPKPSASKILSLLSQPLQLDKQVIIEDIEYTPKPIIINVSYFNLIGVGATVRPEIQIGQPR
jgi:hypothetical protein